VPDADPIPLRPGAAGCAAAAHGYGGQWRSCIGTPTQAAVWRAPNRLDRWLLFLCDAHRDAVPDAHPLDDAEEAELTHRREAELRALAGLGWTPPRPLGPRRRE